MYFGEYGKLVQRKNAKDLTHKEFFELIENAIKESCPKEYQDIKNILDYSLLKTMIPSDGRTNYKYCFISTMKDVFGLQDCPDIDFTVDADLEPGGNEGIYVSWRILAKRAIENAKIEVYPIATFKTLREGPEAYATMGSLCGLLRYFTELFYYCNNFNEGEG